MGYTHTSLLFFGLLLDLDLVGPFLDGVAEDGLHLGVALDAVLELVEEGSQLELLLGRNGDGFRQIKGLFLLFGFFLLLIRLHSTL